MATFLAYTCPAAGHAFPLVPGLLALQERGHRVHLRTDPAIVAGIRRGGLETEPVDPRIGAIRPGESESGRGTKALQEGYRALLERARLDGPDLRRAVAEVGPDAVLVDTLAYGAAITMEGGELPWATTLPSLLPLPGRGIPPYGLGLRPLRGPLGALRDRIGWKLVERVYARAMLPQLNRRRREAGLDPLGSPIEMWDGPDRVLVLAGAPLEYPRADLPANVRFTGASSWDPPALTPARTAFLREPGDPWVLVTCSTDYQGDEALAATAIEALRDEPVRVLVTLADAAATADLPSAPNARVERFVPHGPVLELAAAVVCHGGMGIVQKSIAAAVPIVAVPFGRDQPEVGRRVAECGAGVLLPRRRLDAERLRASVREAIASREGARAAAARLHEHDGPATFADACEELLTVRRPAAPELV
jgi:UDP:flavonoid glycosyltransferase YjiC (YdhE family)